MNINVVRLVLVGTKTNPVVMCKILTVLVIMFFECARVNSSFFGCDSLPLVFLSEEMLTRSPIHS